MKQTRYDSALSNHFSYPELQNIILFDIKLHCWNIWNKDDTTVYCTITLVIQLQNTFTYLILHSTVGIH